MIPCVLAQLLRVVLRAHGRVDGTARQRFDARYRTLEGDQSLTDQFGEFVGRETRLCVPAAIEVPDAFPLLPVFRRERAREVLVDLVVDLHGDRDALVIHAEHLRQRRGLSRRAELVAQPGVK